MLPSSISLFQQVRRSRKKYRYGITFANNPDQLDFRAVSFLEISLADTATLPPPELDSISGLDRVVQLSWNGGLLTSSYSGYFIERSSDSINFSAINDRPIVPLSADEEDAGKVIYLDSLAQNNVNYYYRVYGVSPFGIAGPPSEVRSIATQRKPVPYAPTILEIEEPVPGNFKVSWVFPSEEEALIDGFDVLRASKRDGPFSLVGSVGPAVRTITDNNPLPTNYYSVVVKDKTGVDLPSIVRMSQLENTIPPLPPANISGSVDEAGNIEIDWDDNTEADLRGYRVFYGMGAEGEFAQLTNRVLEQSAYSTTFDLNTLAEEIWVKLRAVDLRENESDYTEPYKLELPDLVPPASPVLPCQRWLGLSGWIVQKNLWRSR